MAPAYATGGSGNRAEAEAAVAGGAGVAGGVDVGDIEISEGDRTGGDQGAVFCDRAGLGGTGDDDLVVGTSDSDGDGALNRAAIAIKNIEGEGFNFGLACCQVLNGARSDRVIPGDFTAKTGSGRVGGNAGSESAEGPLAVGDLADGVEVG